MKDQPNIDLENLRIEIGEVTKSIFNLIKARETLSAKVALMKASIGLQVEDRSIESRLIHSMEDYARAIGLDSGLANKITKELIDSSKAVQRREIYFDKIKEHVTSHGIKEVGIVGSGRMGGWLATYFRPLVKQVILFDQNRKLAEMKANELKCTAGSLKSVSHSDLIFVAVPTSKTVEVVERLLKLKTKARIVEISSVKEDILKKIGRHSQVYSLHPLFGSSAGHFASNRIIIVQRPGRGSDGFVEGLFPHFKVINLSASEHDKFMALILSLPHALALIFAEIFTREKIGVQSEIRSPSFDSMVEISRKALAENPRVYYEIQSLNKYSRAMLKETKKSLERFEHLVSRGHYPDFERSFVKSRKSFQDKLLR